MAIEGYTHKPIVGKAPRWILPGGYALVLEGGGTRGFYTAGVFDAFMEAGILFPYIAAVSASSANALPYIAGQLGRNRQIVEFYVADKRYVGIRNLLLHRSLFNTEFIFREIPQKHIFIDWDMFDQQDIVFLTGAMDCLTGKTVWFEKHDVTPQLEVTIASCAIPLLSPMVRHAGYTLLDGGISDPIPIEKSIADGNSFHVVVLTRNEGYRKSEFRNTFLLKLMYSRYPRVIEAMKQRHEVYNRQIELCEQLEREGRALIIRPLEPLQVDRSGADTTKLLALYDEGRREGAPVAVSLKKV